MKTSVKKMRDLQYQFDMARQARYDELTDESPQCTAMAQHKEAVEIINLELAAVEAEEGQAITSASCYINKDGKIWYMGDE